MPPGENDDKQSKRARSNWARLRARVRQTRTEVEDLHGERTFHTAATDPSLKLVQARDGRNVITPTGPVRTRFGATLARRLDPWDDVEHRGSNTPGRSQRYFGTDAQRAAVQAHYPAAERYTTEAENKEHAAAFAPGAHAYISEWAHENILRGRGKEGYNNARGGFGGWGIGTNFVGTEAGAESAMSKAAVAHAKQGGRAGMRSLERTYALKEDTWKSDDGVIYRYHIPKEHLDKWNLRKPDGSEYGADEKLWVAGAKTGGGAAEAVINSVNREELQERVRSGHLVIEKVQFGPEGGVTTVPVPATALRREDKDLPPA